MFILGTVLNVPSAVSMAIPMFTKNLYPPWCAYLMLLAAVPALVSFFRNGLARRTDLGDSQQGFTAAAVRGAGIRRRAIVVGDAE